MRAVLDASAILAFVEGEAGASTVEAALEESACCSAVNWSEVAQKVRASGRDWPLVRSLLAAYDLDVEPVTESDGEWAALRWRAGEGLSLADRLCMALAERLDGIAITADSSWGHSDRVRQIR